MKVKIISLNQQFEVETAALTIKTSHGQIQVLEEHADLIARLEPGILVLDSPKVVSGSFQVSTENDLDPAATGLFTGFGYLKVEGSQISLMTDRILANIESERKRATERLAELENEEVLSRSQEREAQTLRAFLAVD